LCAYFLINNNNDNQTASNTVYDSSNQRVDTSQNAARAGVSWIVIDWNAQPQRYDEVQDNNVSVKEDSNFIIYTIDESKLFAAGNNNVIDSAKDKLRQVANSINRRNVNGEVKVFAAQNNMANQNENGQQAQQRAEAVKNWLVQNGNIQQNRISVAAQDELPGAMQNQRSGITNDRSENTIDIVIRKS
jgi:outer membrane protein OmpA-like peptidoglycan-associated protein